MKSFSQYYQDKAIDFALNRKRDGIFLDIGAHDGVSLSNTFFFERSRKQKLDRAMYRTDT